MKFVKLFMLVAIAISIQFAFAQTWTAQTSGTNQDLNGLHMISDSEGWIAANGGFLLHTTDGGATWTQVVLTNNDDFQDVAFRDASTGLVAGDNGRVYRTVNGGATWTQVGTPTGVNLRGIDWGSGDVAWACGEDGVVIRTANAGLTWSSVNAGTVERLRRISAIDANLAWAVGDNGQVWHTTNSGATWTFQPSPANGNVDDVQFLSATTGFASGSNNLVMHTSNAGTTWTLRNQGAVNGLDGLHFIDENTGWGVANNSQIFGTTNGGLNWALQNSGGSDLNDVFFTANQQGWAVGEFGTIWHSDQGTGGIPCGDITQFLARCRAGGLIQSRVRFSTPDHNGQTVTFLIDGTDEVVATIANQRAQISLTGYAAGSHTVDISDPAGCVTPFVVNCPAALEASGNTADTETIPDEVTLVQNYPNPFNPSTSIRYGLNEDVTVSLRIYNSLGQEVATLVNDMQSAGYHTVEWNGRDNSGNAVATGMYIYTLRAGDIVQSKQMLFSK